MNAFMGLVICMGLVMLGFTLYLLYHWVKEDKYAKWIIFILVAWLVLSCYLFWFLDQWWVIFVWVFGYAFVVLYPIKTGGENSKLKRSNK